MTEDEALELLKRLWHEHHPNHPLKETEAAFEAYSAVLQSIYENGMYVTMPGYDA